MKVATLALTTLCLQHSAAAGWESEGFKTYNQVPDWEQTSPTTYETSTGAALRPFHHAFPVHDLELAKHFYGQVLGLSEGRSSAKWQDYSLDGHQIVCHLVSSDYRCQDHVNPVDGDRVPVPHTGLAMAVDQFHLFADRLRDSGIDFIVEPHLRFKGQPGEQWTMFFKDPSGNNLEFKAMTNPDNLFAKYNVDEFESGSGGDNNL